MIRRLIVLMKVMKESPSTMSLYFPSWLVLLNFFSETQESVKMLKNMLLHKVKSKIKRLDLAV